MAWSVASEIYVPETREQVAAAAAVTSLNAAVSTRWKWSPHESLVRVKNSRVPGALLPIQRSTQSVYLPRRIERGAHVDQCTSCTPVNHQTVQRPVNERKRCRLFANLRWGSFSPVFIPSGMTWRDVVRTTDADLYVDRTTIVRTLACGAEEAPFASGLRLGGFLQSFLLCMKLLLKRKAELAS